MHIYFLNEQESEPFGIWTASLAEIARRRSCHIHHCSSPKLRPDLQIRKFLWEVDSDGPETILVGCGVEGYVATVASEALNPAGLFLMAPAFYLPDYAQQNLRSKAGKTILVHGWRDNILQPQRSIHFSQESDVELHLYPAGHALEESREAVEDLFDSFIGDVLNKKRFIRDSLCSDGGDRWGDVI